MITVHLLPDTIVHETEEPKSKLTFEKSDVRFSVTSFGIERQYDTLQEALEDKARLDKSGVNHELFVSVIYKLNDVESDCKEQVYLHKVYNVLRVVSGPYWHDYKFYDKASNNTYYFKRSGSSGCCSNPTEEFRELTDKEHFYRLDNDMVKIIKETV